MNRIALTAIALVAAPVFVWAEWQLVLGAWPVLAGAAQVAAAMSWYLTSRAGWQTEARVFLSVAATVSVPLTIVVGTVVLYALSETLFADRSFW